MGNSFDHWDTKIEAVAGWMNNAIIGKKLSVTRDGAIEYSIIPNHTVKNMVMGK